MRDPSASSEDTMTPNIRLPEPSDLYKIYSSGDSTIMSKMPSRRPQTWSEKVAAQLNHRFIDGFTPVYFASVMGTGMSANLLYNFPFPARWLQICGIIMACVALLFFVVLLSFFALSLYYRPKLFSKIHRDPALAPSMGCFVMGYTTLITFLHGVLGTQGIMGIWVLWWLVVFGSFYTCIITFFFSSMAKNRKSGNLLAHTGLSMQYLLPIVTLTVAAALGGLITLDLPNEQLMIITMLVSLIMWSIAMILASIITTVNFWRLFIHKIPNSGQVLTMFLPIGFVGQGAFAILLFGDNALYLLLKNKDTVATSPYVSFLGAYASQSEDQSAGVALIMAIVIMITCTFFAFMSMSIGFLLTIFAYMAVLSKIWPFAKKQNRDFVYQTSSSSPIKRAFVGLLKFQRGFWSMTFPLGTMSLATNRFYIVSNGCSAFRVVSTIYALLVLFTTLGCILGVVYRAIVIFAKGFRIDEDEKVGDGV